MSSINRFIELLIRRKFIIIYSLIIFSIIPLILSALFPPVYKASSHLRMLFHETQTQYIPDMPDRIGMFEYSDKVKVDNTFFAMIRNPGSLKNVIAKMNITDRKRKPVNPDKFNISSEFYLFFKQEGIGTDVVESGEVVEIKGYGSSPERAVQITNAAVDAFTELYANMYKNEARTAIKAMQDRLDYVKEKLKNLEREEFELLKKNSIVDITSEMTQAVTQYYNYIDSLNQNSRYMEEGKNNLKEMGATIKKIPELYLSDKVIERNSLIDNYKSQIVTLETTIAKQKVDITEEHPDIIASRKQIEELRNAIHKEIDRILGNETFSRNSYYTDLEKRFYDMKINLEVYKTTEKVLTKIRDVSLNKMEHMKEIELRTKEFDREQTSLAAEYTNLTKGIANANTLLQMKPSNLVVLNYADLSLMKKSPYFPDKKKFLAISLFLGLTIAFSLILVEEYSDRAIKSLEEASRVFSNRLLLGLPGIKKGVRVKQEEHLKRVVEHSAIKRAAWNIISGIATYSGGTVPKIILFTGAEPDVGTTTTAFIIARELALQGKKVLLLNFSSKDIQSDISSRTSYKDEQQSSLKDMIIESGIQGLSTLNVKKEMKISSVITVENLSEQLNQLEYDCIIMDSDPTLKNNDTLFVSKYANLIVVVAKFRKTSQDVIQNTLLSFGDTENRRSCVLINQI